MSKYIIEFPGGWWIKGNVATGDINTATRYDTRDEAELALKQKIDYFKKTALRATRVVEVEQ